MKNNKISDKGLKYLLDNILKSLSDLSITKISLTNIWRNKYEEGFQDMHFHNSAHFVLLFMKNLKSHRQFFFTLHMIY